MSLKAPLLAAALLIGAATPALADMTVPVDQTRRLTLSAAAADVMVGNPAIADVAMIDDRNLFVMGRGYGVTNLIVLDRAGRTIWSGAVNVSPPDSSQVSLFRGSRVANMACSPRCERTPMPGEEQRDYKDFEPAYAGYNDRASGNASKSAKGQALPAAPESAAGGEAR